MTPKEYFAQIAKERAERPAIRAAGLEALQRLVTIAHHDSGLDAQLFEDCIDVLRLDRQPEREVHEYFKDGDAIWAYFRKRWGKA